MRGKKNDFAFFEGQVLYYGRSRDIVGEGLVEAGRWVIVEVSIRSGANYLHAVQGGRVFMVNRVDLPVDLLTVLIYFKTRTKYMLV